MFRVGSRYQGTPGACEPLGGWLSTNSGPLPGRPSCSQVGFDKVCKAIGTKDARFLQGLRSEVEGLWLVMMRGSGFWFGNYGFGIQALGARIRASGS